MADWLAVDSFGSGLLDSFMDTNLQRVPSWENFGSEFTLQEPAPMTDSQLLLPENGLRQHSGDLPVHMVAMDKVTSAEQGSEPLCMLKAADVAAGTVQQRQPDLADDHSSGVDEHSSPRQGAVRQKLSQRDKAKRFKEKNKRAQQRFREKQKALAQEKEDRLAELHARVQALELERAQLGSRCSLLEKVLTLKSEGKDISEQLAEGMEAVTITSEPMLAGSKPEDWNPNAVYKLSLDDHKPQTQTAQQIKDMTLDEHKRVWTAYVGKWASLLMAAKGDPKSQPAARIQELLLEFVNRAASLARSNPAMLRRLTLHRFDENYDIKTPPPGPEQAQVVLAALKLTKEQRYTLVQLRQHYLQSAQMLLERRGQACSMLQTLNTRQSEGRLNMGGASMEWLAMNEGVDALKQLLWLEQITVYPFVGTMLRQVLTPLQSVCAFVTSFPYNPDFVALTDLIAAQDAASGQSSAAACATAVSQQAGAAMPAIPT